MACAKNLIGEVYRRFEKAGLKIVAAQMLRLDSDQAEGFYAVHRERPFYADLVRYMTSGPVMVQVLEGENADQSNRDIMGATESEEGGAGHDPRRLRRSIEENVVHGSDGPETRARPKSRSFSPRPRFARGRANGCRRRAAGASSTCSACRGGSRRVLRAISARSRIARARS